jgi:CDP-glucose 4,6-dehydratase
MSGDFWRGRAVLITGHTGFKGGWLALWLNHLGAKVTGYSLPPSTTPNLFRLTSMQERITSCEGDVRDAPKLTRLLNDCRPEVVFHLAAQPLVRQSYLDPVETFSTNIMGTVHLLEAVRTSTNTKVVIVVTSDKCYAPQTVPTGHIEGDPMGGDDPYSSSKGCVELITHSYRRSFFSGSATAGRSVGLASVRAGNVIGGGDWAPDRIVPDYVRAAQARRPLQVRNPAAIRPWQHVLDPLSGYLALAEKLYASPEMYSGGWNFGPDGRGISVAEIAERLAKAWRDPLAPGWQSDAGPHPHEAGYLHLDCSKARTVLKWRPRLQIEEALCWTVEWYRTQQRGADAAGLTLNQIAAYEALGER